ncbi:uncharacterized protein C8Q71DRAFT_200882 [Rhodofomes roseus]|uniref:Uncharacterized protein n=1 Tax=Rhodofomes roseus TaxID=34475 RepID=A0ABQ8KU64_9APHY|nr:uncharacterized protein C8Q71DRAFT_200882 [Rhodofomes roseus]KAH9842382.1 hypothetical protein C8Q71DRAFT_200882 [Rhodofomes roseus]
MTSFEPGLTGSPCGSAITRWPSGGHLSLQLGERIGCGRSAVVYAAKVLYATPGQDVLPWTKDPLIGNFQAGPLRQGGVAESLSFIRSGGSDVRAQLTEGALQGKITPRCYGFFTAELDPGLSRFLRSNEDFDLDRTPATGDHGLDDSTCDDPLLDGDDDNDNNAGSLVEGSSGHGSISA